ncbi:MAG: ribonuclease R [Alphaproteobacteria bacterium 16-39-46]|nr:MAG: ribonuclease R [Alphaproteobacteria bacterium 16-39-46]OZA41487.1 MAG: ribonuclease R [Alphaproteobacteria bacterium 17-39-52]HQS84794.1 ribonuclease R [Alphaproteobacteria bacterium]HQS94591.1 ribonuclease R [Alphaproteobacteria bacterium]
MKRPKFPQSSSSSPRDPTYSVVEIVDFDQEDFPIALLVQNGRLLKSPRFQLNAKVLKDHLLSLHDRLLARLEKQTNKSTPIGEPIRLLESSSQVFFGVFQAGRGKHSALVFPTDRRLNESYRVSSHHSKDAKSGDFVRAHLYKGRPPEVRIKDVLGHASDPKLFSLIAIHQFGIPHHFREEDLKEAQKVSARNEASSLREDLRNYPFVTIDGEDARDFDDAIWAETDQTPGNEGGFHLLVAVADVSFYVREESLLDQTAFERGNSVYFSDRVVPMLPEDLSNDVCSLKPNVPRNTLAVHLWINASGKLLRYKFIRAVIQSEARLTYTEVQSFFDKKASHLTSLPQKVQALIPCLYQAYQALSKERLRRGTLDFDLPERQVIFNENHTIEKIVPRPRLQSHSLIEEFMILANIAAASFLSSKNLPCMYRVHDKPSLEKIEALRTVLKPLGFSLPHHTKITPQDLDQVLHKSEHLPQQTFIHELILRSQCQANYSPLNIGHFGLHLSQYAHFTSPIRRYADILVHRAIITALKLGPDGLSAEKTVTLFEGIGQHLSDTERRAMKAERDTLERYITSYMENHVNASFAACISGIHRSGIFVELKETGANGFIPLHLLPHDRYIHHEKLFTLEGRNRTFKIGDVLDVTLLEANSHTNSLLFCPTEKSGKRPQKFNKKPRRRS